MFTERTAAAFAIESTVGTSVTGYTVTSGAHADTTPSTDQFLIYDAFNPVQADTEAIALNPAHSSLQPGDIVPGRSIYVADFHIKPYGSGTAGTPPKWWDLLRICGYRRLNISGAAPTTCTPAAAGSSGYFGDAGYADAGYYYRYATSKVTIGTYGTAWTNTALKVATADVAPTANQAVTVTVDDPGSGKEAWIFRSCGHVSASVAPYYYIGKVANGATTFIDYGTADTNLGPPFPADFDNAAGGGANVALAAGSWCVPRDSAFESASFAFWLDGYIVLLKGARASLTQLTAEAGGIPDMTMRVMGLYSGDPISESIPEDVSNSTPPKFESAGITILPENSANLGMYTTSFTPVVKTATFMTGTQLQERRNANAANSVTEIGIVQRFQARYGLNFEADTSYNPVAAMKNGYKARSSFQMGTGVGSRIVCYAPQLRFQAQPPFADASGYRVHDANWVPQGSFWSAWYHI